MAWGEPKTNWNDGELVDSADMNEIGNDLIFLHEPAFVSVNNSADVSIDNNLVTSLPFNNERLKTVTSMHSISSQTTRLKPPYDGLYYIHGLVQWAGNSTGNRQVRITLNGAVIAQISRGSLPSGAEAMEVNTIRRLSATANDYVELDVFQSSGAALNILNNAFSPEFMMIFLGKA